MRAEELRAHGLCSLCGEGIGKSGVPVFWTVKLEQHAVDLNAVHRQSGLEALFNGNAAIAQAMGPDEEMTKTFAGETDLTVCHSCALKFDHPTTFMDLVAVAHYQEEQREAAGS